MYYENFKNKNLFNLDSNTKFPDNGLEMSEHAEVYFI